MHTLFTSIHIPNITTFKTRKTLKHSSRGSTPYPEALEIIKFPVAGDSFSRTETDCQGHMCHKTACFAPLDRLPSASALRSSSDGDLFILQSQRKRSLFACPIK